MNEQPQPSHLPPVEHPEGGQPLYKAEDQPASSFSGYDLAPPRAVPSGAPQRPVLHAEQVDVTWEASEYIHHAKSTQWFLGYVGAMLALLAIAYFVTHAWTFVVLVIALAITVGIFATRPPRTLHYALTDTGLQIENTHYSYSDFRTFGVIADGGLFSVMLIPTKRFMPAVSMYFAENDGEKIVDVLGARLPMEEMHLDMIERLVRRLRF